VSAALTPREIAPSLEAAMSTLRAELGSLPERVLTFHPAPGEGCTQRSLRRTTATGRSARPP
jgi:hypothetical protein